MRILATACLLATFATFVSAQNVRPNTRQGFWIGLGLGGGTVGVECSQCGDHRVSGAGGYLRFGGTISPGFLLGVESNAWATEYRGVEHRLGFGSVVGYWYPSRNGAFYVKLGLGGMTYTRDNGTDELTARAGTLAVGTGYEIRIGRNISAVPYLNLLGSGKTDFEVNGQPVATDADLTLNLLQVGLGLTWH